MSDRLFSNLAEKRQNLLTVQSVKRTFSNDQSRKGSDLVQGNSSDEEDRAVKMARNDRASADKPTGLAALLPPPKQTVAASSAAKASAVAAVAAAAPSVVSPKRKATSSLPSQSSSLIPRTVASKINFSSYKITEYDSSSADDDDDGDEDGDDDDNDEDEDEDEDEGASSKDNYNNSNTGVYDGNENDKDGTNNEENDVIGPYGGIDEECDNDGVIGSYESLANSYNYQGHSLAPAPIESAASMLIPEHELRRLEGRQKANRMGSSSLHIKEIKQANTLQEAELSRLANSTMNDDTPSFKASIELNAGTIQKKKSQITYLAQQAIKNDASLRNRWASGQAAKAKSAARLGLI